jgi:D-alanyl-lipoteichoic acid acyltransferase DltB (MBOAT superfamily)
MYAVLQRTSRTLMMLYVVLFSLFFFSRMNPDVAMLLPLTALLSWAMTRRMNECKGDLRRRWLWFIVVIDLLPLLYFKYTNFGIDVLNTLLSRNLPMQDIILPVGISFYTFQAIAHTVDVYRRHLRLKMDFLEYLFYLSFFPLLLAGPITRPGSMLQQMRENKEVNPRLIYTGLWLVMMGVLKKCVVADYLAQFNNWAFDEPMLYNGFELMMALVGFSVQIYCDFSGYSDMSIGIAAMMGFRLRENFNFPYQALNVSEFWRRWHISLSTWFRDYVYIPLGGNRRNKLRLYFNNFITMVVAGLWHGSTMMFALWGAMHGVALVVHKMFRKLFLDRMPSHRWWVKVPSWLLCQTFILFTWIFFRCADLSSATGYLHRMFTQFDAQCIPAFIAQRPLWIAILLISMLVHCLRERWFYRLQERFITLHWTLKSLLFLIVLQLAIEFSTNEVQPFLYYKF